MSSVRTLCLSAFLAACSGYAQIVTHSLMRSILVLLFCSSVTGMTGQVLVTGDVAIVGINANNGGCSGNTAEDEITFVCLKPINTGARLWLTDKGYEYQFAGFWGTTEGIVQMQRTGANIPAGTMVTLRINNAGTATPVSPGWAASVIVAGMNLNSGGDQVFIFQANAGASFTGAGNNGVFNNCTLLYGFSTVAPPNDWVSFQNTSQRSGLPPGSLCFSMAPVGQSDFIKYMGPVGDPTFLIPRTPRQWIVDIDDNSRWTNSLTTCTLYNSSAPNYAGGGITFPVTIVVPVAGRWTGAKTTDWFDCKNWDDANIPTSATAVTVNPIYGYGANLACVVGNTTAIIPQPLTANCASLTVTTGGAPKNLTIDNGKTLQVVGTTSVSATAGAVGSVLLTVLNGNFTTTNLSMAGIAGAPARQGKFVNEFAVNSVTVSGNILINPFGGLDLQAGGIGGIVQLAGNYTNNQDAVAFEDLGSSMIFNGAGAQSINTAGFTEDFGNITLTKPTNDLTLNAPINVRGTFTMTTGRLMTTSTNIFTLLNGASISGASDNSFVHGPMINIGPDVPFVQFPVGKGTRIHPVSVSNLTMGPTDAFISEYFSGDPNLAIGVPFETPPLDHISACEYWQLDQFTGTPVGKVTLSWKAPTSCGVTNLPDLRVAKWDGAMWRDRGGVAVGTVLLGTIPTSAAQELVFAPGWWTLASISAANPLPIELLSFTARPEGRTIRLDWATATETDNDYFTVERSKNGSDFEEVLRQQGAGTSVTALSYTDLDPWPHSGVSYYRLRQTDFNNATSTSDLVAVRMPTEPGNGLALVNSSEEVIAIHDFAPGSLIHLMDMTGRMVWQGRVVTEGRSLIPTGDLPVGAYLIRVSDDIRMESAPFVK